MTDGVIVSNNVTGNEMNIYLLVDLQTYHDRLLIYCNETDDCIIHCGTYDSCQDRS